MRFEGVIPILPTPFRDDETLDLASWSRLLEFMVSLKVDGVTILGVLGEANRLTDHERDTLISHAVDTLQGRLPLIVGASHSGTAAAVYQALRAEQLGAQAVMLAPSKDASLSDERILTSYRRVADKTSIPIVLQDHPASSEVPLSIPLITRLLHEIPTIACIKQEAIPTAPKISQLLESLGKQRAPILTGLGALYAPFDLAAGSSGFNTGFAFPEVLIAMRQAALQEDWARVHSLFARFAALIIFEQQPGVAIRKAIFKRRGLLASAQVRHPGAMLAVGMSQQLDALLAHTLPGVDLTQAIAL
ncbi:MAG: dihydrodipicolinate synthase family protein [Betaproteobacteria bacterium]|nr:dihydrodipicolinate synthase family protein [Betaproteobacteria bacterium]